MFEIQLCWLLNSRYSHTAPLPGEGVAPQRGLQKAKLKRRAAHILKRYKSRAAEIV